MLEKKHADGLSARYKWSYLDRATTLSLMKMAGQRGWDEQILAGDTAVCMYGSNSL